MRHMLKVLLITIVGLVVENGEGMNAPPPPPAASPILDLPIGVNGTPGLVVGAGNPIFTQKTVNGVPNANCLHIIVPNTPAHTARVAQGGGIAAARTADGNIYFPRNGAQPTTPEAVEYSCANIDNRENSPITDWYMKMFGVIDKDGGNSDNNDDYIKAGWNADATAAQRIILFDASVDATPVNDPNIPGTQISRRALFEREFRKIASTCVGRVLLYRILIEIRRHQAGSNAGCTENPTFVGATSGTLITDRCRNINIAYDCGSFGVGFGFSDLLRQIVFVEDPNNLFGNCTLFSVIGKSTRSGYTHIINSSMKFDVALFHEMLHWFHHLRNPKRNYLETNTNKTLHFNDTVISQYYWHGIDCCILAWNTNNENNYAHIWSSGFLSHLDFEEMRTLLGMPHNSNIANYLNGDDLSENLYRMCTGMPLRFGYEGRNFYEDRKVIDRVINACWGNYIVYLTGKDSHVDFQYNAGRPIFGKGKVQ